MEKIQRYIKLPKEFVQNNLTTTNKIGLVVAYLYFHTTIDGDVYTSIDCICSELNMSIKSHGERRNQNTIRNILFELISMDVIKHIPTEYCLKFDNITNNQIFKIKINYQSFMFNSVSKYVKIEKTEYDKIASIKCKQTFKIFNIFYQIKSHVCMDDNCLHICYPSIKSLCKLCGCSDSTLIDIIKILCENKMLYIYKLNDQEKISIHRNIEYIFSLQKYSKQDVIEEFVA